MVGYNLIHSECMVYLTQDRASGHDVHQPDDSHTWAASQEHAAFVLASRDELRGKRYEDVIDLLVSTQRALYESRLRERALETELRQTERALNDRTEATYELKRAAAEAQHARRDAEARAGAASDEVSSLHEQLEDLTRRTGLWTICLACGHHIGEPMEFEMPAKPTPPMTDAERERLARKAEKERIIKQFVAPQDRSSPWLDWL